MRKVFNPMKSLSILFLAGVALSASAAVLTEDTRISINNTNYDRSDLVVTNCTVTVDGPHLFQSITLQNGGKLTHAYAANGALSNLVSVVDEPHTLAPTNTIIAQTNVMPGSVLVKDASGATRYVDGTDFQVVYFGTQVDVELLPGSAIAPEAALLISYSVDLGTVASGLYVSTTGEFVIEPGGSIDVTGCGFGPGNGPGQGASRTTNFPALYVAGAGGGYGGFGGLSSSMAPGGNWYGLPVDANIKGSPGGAGLGNGAPGGGLVSLNIGGELLVDGSIISSGADATNARAGGGSGGSIHIQAQSVRGTGSLIADGGAGEPRDGGGGGGGRIFLLCPTNDFQGHFSAKGGTGWMAGGAGTVVVAEAIPGGKLIVDNGGVAGTNTFLVLSGGVEVAVRGKAKVQVGNPATLKSLFVGAGSSLELLQVQIITVAENVQIEAGGRIDLTGKGYPANAGTGRGSYISSSTPMAGGGGYGGNGGALQDPYFRYVGGIAYGSLQQPADRGSGGGAFYGAPGSAGGGAIRLDVKGELVLDGAILADGEPAAIPTVQRPYPGAGGSGGSVWLSVGKLSGPGLISANGGDGVLPSGSGGGGGRIAIYAPTNVFTGQIQARGGTGQVAGGAGTIFVQGYFNRPPRVLVDNGGRSGTNTPLTGLVSYSALVVDGGAIATVQTTSFQIDSVVVGSNSWLSANLGSVPLFLDVAHDVTIRHGGGISMDGLGYSRGSGMGAGRTFGGFGGGGGYGGYGGNNYTNQGGGNAYGSVTNPRDLGSGGGYFYLSELPISGSVGGGALLLNIRGNLLLDGTLSANGNSGATNRNGGGSGGSVNVSVTTISGGGLLRANGGAGLGGAGGGGGGRIALLSRTNSFTGGFEARGGSGAMAGGAGTIYIQDILNRTVPQVLVDNGGQIGTNALLGAPSGPAFDLVIKNGGRATLGYNFMTVRSLRVESDSALVVGPLSQGGYILHVTGDAIVEAGARVLGVAPVYSTSGSGRYSYPYGGAGGSHAGYGSDPRGATDLVGQIYGSIIRPGTPGSSGGWYNTLSAAAAGGGAVQLDVDGILFLDGRVEANGMSALEMNSGGGSGGSVLVDVNRITGSGSISADGGDGAYPNGGGGGGGHVALLYKFNEFTGTMSARGGKGPLYGGAGTVYIKGGSQDIFGRVFIDNAGHPGALTGITPTSPAFHLAVSAGAVAFPFPGTVGVLSLQSLQVGPGGGFTHTTSQRFLDLTILGNADVQTNGAIVADAKGYSLSSPGPGAGQASSSSGSGGGGYGGAGGDGAADAKGGVTYGNAESPFDPGSSGGMSPRVAGSSEGGGVIRMSVGGILNIDGVISANGNDGWWEDSGGGAGGSVWLTAREIRGSGAIMANGGVGEPFTGGGGGGGRIALYYETNRFGETAGYMIAGGGEGAHPGQPGTIFLSTNLPVPIVISQSTPAPKEPASYVNVLYSLPMDPVSVAESEVSLTTPNETLTPVLSVLTGDPRTVQVAFPAQNTPGEYKFVIGPQIKDWLGVPASISYTGTFTLESPLVLGSVTDPNGLAVQGVTLQPSGGLASVTTDASGNFSLPVLPGWSGTVIPFLAGKEFLPASMPLFDVTADRPNNRFIAANSGLLRLSCSLLGTNLNVTWFAISNVTYNVLYSTNLVDWTATGTSMVGDGAEHVLTFPVEEGPAAFITLQPTY